MVSFRLLLISAVLVLAVVAASANSAASERVVKMDGISWVQDSDTLVVVNLKSQQKITDGKVTVAIPELGLRARHNVDFSRSSRQTVHLIVPDGSLSDQYVRVVFTSDHGRRVKYVQVLSD